MTDQNVLKRRKYLILQISQASDSLFKSKTISLACWDSFQRKRLLFFIPCHLKLFGRRREWIFNANVWELGISFNPALQSTGFRYKFKWLKLTQVPRPKKVFLAKEHCPRGVTIFSTRFRSTSQITISNRFDIQSREQNWSTLHVNMQNIHNHCQIGFFASKKRICENSNFLGFWPFYHRQVW